MTTPNPNDQIALVDLDGTACDYDAAMREEQEKLRAPEEPPYMDRFDRVKAGFYEEHKEPPHLEARRKLIQQKTGFWRNLKRHPLGFEIIDDLREIGFGLMVLTKGPNTTPSAWGEKLEWSHEHIPEAHVTISQDKSLVYGRVLVDDWPLYYKPWLANRPRGLVVCVAHPWNERHTDHPNIFRYDGTNREQLRALLKRAFNRKSREELF